MTNLWPEDIAHVAQRAPVVLLREQAFYLGERTKNMVKAEVEEFRRPDLGSHADFNYTFYIVATALQNYRFELFAISHGIELYPVFFKLDWDVSKELTGTPPAERVPAENEDEFVQLLAKIFATKKTRKVIAAILGQSEGYNPNPEEIPF